MSAAVIAMTVIAPALAGAWLLSKRLQKLAERAVPPAGRFADTQYARLHYIERGTARDDPGVRSRCSNKRLPSTNCCSNSVCGAPCWSGTRSAARSL